MTMSKNQLLVRRAMRARRCAEMARARCNEVLLRLEFPDRSRPVYVAPREKDFSIVETAEDGELTGIVIPFRKAK